MNNSKKIFNIIILLVIVACMFYILNIYTPLYADDYTYIYSFFDKQPIDSIGDIIKSQYAHYFSMNGRIVTHFLAQLFLFLGKDFFNIINSFAFLVLGLLIYYHGVGTYQKMNPTILLFIYVGLFLITPAFGECYLWVVGSSTYMYGNILILLYLVPFRKMLSSQKNSKSYKANIWKKLLKAIVMFLMGVIAGNTSENISVSLTIIVFLYLVCFKLQKIKIEFWMSGLGNILGLLLLLFSPGIQKRLQTAGGGGV